MPVTTSARTESPADQLLVIRVGGERYAVPISAVATIAAESAAVSGAVSALQGASGVLPWRGRSVPLFDQRAQGARATERAHAPALLLHSEHGAVGVIVDRIEGLIIPTPGSFVALPAWADKTVFRRIIRDIAGMILLLDPVVLVGRIVATSGAWRLAHQASLDQITASRGDLAVPAPPAARVVTAPTRRAYPGLQHAKVPARLLVCRLSADQDTRRVALDADAVVNIVNLDTLHHLPDTPPAMLGFNLWQGRAVPVFNLARSFDGIPAQRTRLRLLLCHVRPAHAGQLDDMVIGLPVSVVEGLKSVPTGTILRAHDLPLASDIVEGAFDLAGAIVYLVNVRACAEAMR